MTTAAVTPTTLVYIFHLFLKGYAGILIASNPGDLLLAHPRRSRITPEYILLVREAFAAGQINTLIAYAQKESSKMLLLLLLAQQNVPAHDAYLLRCGLISRLV